MAWLYLYASIGAVLWLLCDGPGAIRDEYLALLKYRSTSEARYVAVFAVVLMILGWPKLIWNCAQRFWRAR